MARKTKKSAKEMLAAAVRPQRVITINTNGALLARHQELESELADLVNNDADQAEKLAVAEQIRQVEIDSEDFLLDLTLQALPSGVWRNQLVAHPPTEEQKKDGAIADQDALTRDVLAQSVIDHQLDDEDVANIEALSLAQWRMVGNAVWTVNGGDNAVPFSQIGSLIRQASADESTPQEGGGSASDGSRAGSRASGSRSKSSIKKDVRLGG